MIDCTSSGEYNYIMFQRMCILTIYFRCNRAHGSNFNFRLIIMIVLLYIGIIMSAFKNDLVNLHRIDENCLLPLCETVY